MAIGLVLMLSACGSLTGFEQPKPVIDSKLRIPCDTPVSTSGLDSLDVDGVFEYWKKDRVALRKCELSRAATLALLEKLANSE